MIIVTNRQITTMKNRQPVGTNHSQFRDHQLRRIGGVVPGGRGGGGVLVGSTMRRFTRFRADVESETETVAVLNQMAILRKLRSRSGCCVLIKFQSI
jgi:hypothetical protein